MVEKYALGVDAGTTGSRAILANAEGNVVGLGRSFCRVNYPQEGWAEQEPQWWWNTFVEAVRDALKKAKIDPRSIVSLGIAHQRETIVPVDEAGKPLRSGILWMDRRAVRQARWIESRIGALEYLRRTGVPPSAGWSISKILWVKDNQPQIFEKSHKWLLVHDYLVHELTGNFVTSWACSCTTGALDITRFDWADDILETCGVPREMFPDNHPPGEEVGVLRREPSNVLGLPEGTPVANGGGDQQCGALGCGLITPGPTSVNLGTSVVIETYSDQPLVDPQLRFICRVSPIPGKYALESGAGGAVVLQWYKENFGNVEDEVAKKCGADPYDILTAEAEVAPPGSLGLTVIPHWIQGRGIVSGFGLTHKRNHLVRAILEGIAYEVRNATELMEEGARKRITELRLYGGGSRSRLWCQIFADVSGREVVKLQTEETTALGAAILAAKAGGLFNSVPEAAMNMVRIGERLQPGEKTRETYNQLYKERFQPLLRRLCETSDVKS